MGYGESGGSTTAPASKYDHEREYTPTVQDDTHKETSELASTGKVLRFGEVENTRIDANDWQKRWKNTGAGRWQLKDAHVFLQRYASKLRGWEHRANKRVLIPLSGKSVDSFWFAQQGVGQVVGIEGSDEAIKQLLTEQGGPDSFTYTAVTQHIGRYTTNDNRIVIFRADLFDAELTADIIGGPVTWIWDRAAIVALHWLDHARYAEKTRSLQAKPRSNEGDGYDILIGAYWHNQQRGPPFNSDLVHLRAVYGRDSVAFDQLDDIDAFYSGWANAGFTEMRERLYGVQLRAPTAEELLDDCAANGTCALPQRETATVDTPSAAGAASKQAFERVFSAKTVQSGEGTHSTWDVDGHQLSIDAAPAFGGKGLGQGPLPTFLASIASCQQVTANVVLNTDSKLAGKVISSIEWTKVDGEFNSEVLEKGVQSEDPATWKRVRLEASVKSNLNEQELAYLISEVERRCPLTALLVKGGTVVENKWNGVSPLTHGKASTSAASTASSSAKSAFERVFSAKTVQSGEGTHSTWDVDGHQLSIDAAPAFGGKGLGQGPLPTFLASIASCQQVTANVVLNTDSKLAGKVISSIEWTKVDGEFNSEVLEKGVQSDDPATWKRVRLEANVKSNLRDQELSYLISEVERRCPLTALLVKGGTVVENNWKNV